MGYDLVARELERIPKERVRQIARGLSPADRALAAPPGVMLTSFSILFARYKGDLETLVRAAAAGVSIVNYGVAIAHMHGVLKRSLEPFPRVLALLENP